MMDTIRPLPVISTVQVVNKRTAPGYLLHASQKCSNSTEAAEKAVILWGGVIHRQKKAHQLMNILIFWCAFCFWCAKRGEIGGLSASQCDDPFQICNEYRRRALQLHANEARGRRDVVPVPVLELAVFRFDLVSCPRKFFEGFCFLELCLLFVKPALDRDVVRLAFRTIFT